MAAPGIFRLRGVETGVPTVVPASLKPVSTTTKTLFTGRNPRILRPLEQKVYTKAYRRIVFNFPSRSVYDFTTGYLSFHARTTPAPAGGPPPTTWSCFMSYIPSCIQALRFKIGNTTVSEITDYGHKATLDWFLTTDYINNTNQLPDIGCGAQADRITWSTGRYYRVPLTFGPLATKALNFSSMHQQCYLEIDIYPPDQCLEADAGTLAGDLDYTISDVFFVADDLPAIENEWLLRSNNLNGGDWPMLETDIFTTPLNAVSKTDLQVHFKASSVQRIMIIQKPSAELLTPATADRFTLAHYNGLKSCRLRVNGQYFPLDPIDCTTIAFRDEAWWHFKKAMHCTSLGQKAYDKRINISRDQFYSDSLHKFFLTISLEQNHAPGDLNPVSILQDDGLFIELEWAAPYTGDVLVLVSHWVVYGQRSDGSIYAGR